MLDSSTKRKESFSFPILLYDGECMICSKAVRFVYKNDKSQRIRFCPQQSELGQKLMLEHGIDNQQDGSIVFIDKNKAYLYSDAILQISVYLGLPLPLLFLARSFPKSFRNWIYRRIANNRYQLGGKLQSCVLPDQEFRRRILV